MVTDKKIQVKCIEPPQDRQNSIENRFGTLNLTQNDTQISNLMSVWDKTSKNKWHACRSSFSRKAKFKGEVEKGSLKGQFKRDK